MSEPEPRCSAWGYVLTRGLAGQFGTLDLLAGIGLRAWRLASWEGIPEAKVAEGPYVVHTWPERIFAEVISYMLPGAFPPEPRSPLVVKSPRYGGAVAGDGAPWDGDDIRPC